MSISHEAHCLGGLSALAWHACDEIPHHIDELGNVEEDIDTLQLLEDHDELLYREESDGTYYMGGVGGGLGLGIKHLNHLEHLVVMYKIE
ncbi:hypothetical protein C8R48DRAFT_780347 [Suillus tomentosus]|nr:hypothetical protein C8R48DRAFT_780347 [Suillus tomentosus]